MCPPPLQIPPLATILHVCHAHAARPLSPGAPSFPLVVPKAMVHYAMRLVLLSLRNKGHPLRRGQVGAGCVPRPCPGTHGHAGVCVMCKTPGVYARQNHMHHQRTGHGKRLVRPTGMHGHRPVPVSAPATRLASSTRYQRRATPHHHRATPNQHGLPATGPPTTRQPTTRPHTTCQPSTSHAAPQPPAPSFCEGFMLLGVSTHRQWYNPCTAHWNAWTSSSACLHPSHAP